MKKIEVVYRVGDKEFSTRKSAEAAQRFSVLEEYGALYIKSVRKAAGAILTAFIWENTPEGAIYWNNVYSKLEELIAAYEATHPKKK